MNTENNMYGTGTFPYTDSGTGTSVSTSEFKALHEMLKSNIQTKPTEEDLIVKSLVLELEQRRVCYQQMIARAPNDAGYLRQLKLLMRKTEQYYITKIIRESPTVLSEVLKILSKSLNLSTNPLKWSKEDELNAKLSHMADKTFNYNKNSISF